MIKKKRSFSLFLLVATCCISLWGCKKFVLETAAGFFINAADLWEDRPAGVSCTPSSSPATFDGQALTFADNHLLCINIDMDAQDFERMRNESRFGPSIQEDEGAAVMGILLEYLNQCDVPFPSEFNWYSANIQVDGESLNNVGIRKKGFLGSIFSPAPAIKVTTNRFTAGQTFGNTFDLTLNNNAEDPTRIKSCLSYTFFQWANYPAPRCNLANVSINNEALGIYAHLETMDEQFLNRAFGNANGHLYEGQLADFVADWLPRWDAKTATTNAYGTPLLDIANALESSDAGLVDALEPHLNLDRFITFWALEYLLQHHDGYTANRNNFYVYIDPADGNRATLIPWGMNYTRFDEGKQLSSYLSSELPRRLSKLPEIKERFGAELQRLLDDVWDEAALLALIDGFEVQVRTGQSDPDYDWKVQELRDWVLERRAIVQASIDAGLPNGEDEFSGTCDGGNE